MTKRERAINLKSKPTITTMATVLLLVMLTFACSGNGKSSSHVNTDDNPSGEDDVVYPSGFTLKVFADNGLVTSSDSSISCGSDCGSIYEEGSQVELLATAQFGYTFRGWKGACTGNSVTCTVDLQSHSIVIAEFESSATTTIQSADLGESCNGNSTCEWPETFHTCPSDCSTSDSSDFTLTPKYVDQNCEFNGNGLNNNCAASEGASGRFNDLQAALESLSAGEHLFIHPGFYWKDWSTNPEAVDGFNEHYGIFTLEGKVATAVQPIFISAANPSNPPVLFSAHPNDAMLYAGLDSHQDDILNRHASLPAFSVRGSQYVFVEDLVFMGRAQFSGGANNTLRNTNCSIGWGVCGDGNWSCLRVEGCSNCRVHHNLVMDVAGERDSNCNACRGEEIQVCRANDYNPDRGSGMKEFTSNQSIWEFNTVKRVPQWGYDQHRDSDNVVFRFNKIQESLAVGARSERSDAIFIDGNTITATGTGIGVLFPDTATSTVRVSYNTIYNVDLGISVFKDASYDYVATISNNIIGKFDSFSGEFAANLFLNDPDNGHFINYNVYDASGIFRFGDDPYDKRIYSLYDWQITFVGVDINSRYDICNFVDAPQSIADSNYDFNIISGDACESVSSTGSEVGAFGLSSCVGAGCTF